MSHRVHQTSTYEQSFDQEERITGSTIHSPAHFHTMPSSSEARMKEIERLLEEIKRLDSIVTLVEKEAEKKICDLERKIQP